MKSIAACIALFASTALACDCTQQPVSEGLQTNPLVFGAIVTGAMVKGDHLEVEISDVVNIKGDARSIHSLQTPIGNGSCGYVVSVPAKYVFFTDRKGGFSICGATRLFDNPDLGTLTRDVVLKWNSPR